MKTPCAMSRVVGGGRGLAMSRVRAAGPWRTLQVSGREVPWYVVPFDRNGVCAAPATRRHLVDALADLDATDVHVFSHGWNNDWDVVDSGGMYERFIAEYVRLASSQGRPRDGARTALVGIFWPSMALSGNTGPQMAAAGDTADPREEARTALEAASLADEVVAVDHRARFYELVASEGLDETEVRELARMLLPLYGRPDDELAGPADGAPDEDELVALWQALVTDAAPREHEVVEGLPPERLQDAAVAGDDPGAAGVFDLVDPRWIVRGASVLVMKDRAGRVGARGVRDLLHAIQRAAPHAQVHLAGHSYGCKVVLSAVAAAEPPRPVRSILLLQPALSYLAFAAPGRVPGTDRPGGYRVALQRCELPIVATFTRRDVPLRRLFHLGVRRRSDVGEQDIGAAARDVPRSRFAAMGGYGPGGLAAGEVRDAVAHGPDAGPYELPGPPVEVVALEAHDAIGGHGEIVVPATTWALFNLVAADGPIDQEG